ncbi:MAG: DUF3626 domain-containing protein [Peptococcia bacterium]
MGTPRKKIDKVVAVVATLIFVLECFPLTAQGIGFDWGQLTNAAVIAQLQKVLPQKEFTAPDSLWAGTIKETSLSVYWRKATNNQGVVDYAVYVNGQLRATTTGTNTRLEGLTKGTTYSIYVVATDRATGESVSSKKISVKTAGFLSLEAEKAHYAAVSAAKNEKINWATAYVDNNFKTFVTKPIDRLITSETPTGWKFTLGAIEGGAKALVDFAMLGLITAEYALPENLQASTLNTYYDYADNPEKYTIKNLARVGGAVATVLAQEGIGSLQRALSDSREFGKLAGGTAALLGTGKVIQTAGKGLSVSSKPAATVPAVTAKPVTAVKPVGTAKAAAFLSNTFTKVKFNAITFKYDEGATLFPTAGKAVRAGQAVNLNEIPTLRNLAARQKEFLAKSGREFDPELAQILEQMAQNCALRIRVPNELTLKKIFEDGRFKSQLEVGSSSGCYNPDLRKKLSYKLFGTDIKNTPNSQYEVYGYLGNTNFIGEARNYPLRNYGDTIVTLDKENLLPRTTFTLGDSLANWYYFNWEEMQVFVASKLDDIFTACGDVNSIDFIKYKVKGKKEISPTDIVGTNKHGDGTFYIEAQYHGGVLDKDIRTVTFLSDYKPPQIDAKLYQLLKENNIQLNWLSRETNKVTKIK